MSHVTDASNLALDPDLDSYYLMDGLYFRLPTIVEFAGRIRGLGVQALDRDTQQNSALVEQTTAAEALRSPADLLMDEIAKFRVA
jgi:hypothetical protein